MTKIIDLIATGSKKDQHALAQSLIFIEKMGFKPRVSPTIFGPHPLYVNTDSERVRNLTDALYAEDSDIIWCLRGGSGTSRLIPSLLHLTPPQKSKVLIGLSDVTALLLFLSQHWGWQVVHGPTAHYAALDKLTPHAVDTLVHLIKGSLPCLNCENLIPLNSHAQKPQTIRGILTGGNMSLVQSSLATPWHIQTQERILFFEDINEPPYRVAERLEHLRQAGVFQPAKAILFGDFSHEEPAKNPPELLEYVLKDFAQHIEIPCFTNLPVGHKDFCLPLIINAPATLTTGMQGTLTQNIMEELQG